MNEKYLKHTVENLIEFAYDLTCELVDVTENDYMQAIEALKMAETLLSFYKNELYELAERVDDLKYKISKMLFIKMVDNCREIVEEQTGIRV